MPKLQDDLVSEDLQDLIPLAEKWAVSADTERHRLMEEISYFHRTI
jgi:hypothetical protein